VETLSELKKNKKNNKAKGNKNHISLGKVFDKHIKCEFQNHDVDATMKTMIKEPLGMQIMNILEYVS
jgi:hypothetical protein